MFRRSLSHPQGKLLPLLKAICLLTGCYDGWVTEYEIRRLCVFYEDIFVLIIINDKDNVVLVIVNNKDNIVLIIVNNKESVVLINANNKDNVV